MLLVVVEFPNFVKVSIVQLVSWQKAHFYIILLELFTDWSSRIYLVSTEFLSSNRLMLLLLLKSSQVKWIISCFISMSNLSKPSWIFMVPLELWVGWSVWVSSLPVLSSWLGWTWYENSRSFAFSSDSLLISKWCLWGLMDWLREGLTFGSRKNTVRLLQFLQEIEIKGFLEIHNLKQS